MYPKHFSMTVIEKCTLEDEESVYAHMYKVAVYIKMDLMYSEE